MTTPDEQPAEQPTGSQESGPAVKRDVFGNVVEQPTPPEKRIGERIREARQRPDYDLSVEALSRLCRECDIEGQGITPTTLLRYEQGKVLPGAREIRVLCSALDISADKLLFGVESSMDMTLAEGLATLARVIQERAYYENPLRRHLGAADLVKSEKIRQAKVPQKR